MTEPQDPAEAAAALIVLVWTLLYHVAVMWLFVSFTCSVVKSLNHECDKRYVIETYLRLEGDLFCVKPD